jgi:polysaccharide biosynthesis/export protein
VGLLWYRSFGGQLSFRSYSLSRKPGASGLATCFVTFLVAGACHVLRWTVLSESCCAFNLPVPSCRQLKSSGCLVRRSEHGQSPEMKILTRYVILRAPGRFVLQPEVIASTRDRVPSPATAPAFSAPPTGELAAVESAPSPEGVGTGVSTCRASTQPAKPDGPGDPTPGGEHHRLYRLTESDAVDLNLAFSSDFNRTLTVQPDGFVALKGASTLFLEGLPVPQIQPVVSSAHRGLRREPEVTTTFKGFDRPYFLASGEVARPGKYELRGDLPVNEAIAIAGGFTQQARHSQVILFRRISAYVAESHLIDVKRMLDSRDLHKDLRLQPGDFIYVPQRQISKVRKYVPTNSMSRYMDPWQY